MASELYSGTETVGTTEWSLTTDTAGPDADTTDGMFQVFLELHNLAAGDEYRFRAHEKVLSSSTQRIAFETTFMGAQAAPVWISPGLILLHGWDFTIAKVAGTDRAINWSVRQA